MLREKSPPSILYRYAHANIGDFAEFAEYSLRGYFAVGWVKYLVKELEINIEDKDRTNKQWTTLERCQLHLQ